MNRKFWHGKRVVITGHTGFKGSWLSIWLHHLGAKVNGYSLAPPSQPNLCEVAGVKEIVNSIEGDIRDLQHLNSFFEEQQPEIIIHMAAQALVRESYLDPITTYATNVMGTANVLEASRDIKSLRVIIIVTSDKCYENQEWYWGYRENEAMGGFDPYSSSKGCAELVTAAYRRSFFSANGENNHVRVATVRAGNVIGGGDWAKDRLIPDLMQAYLEEKKVTIRYPSAIRPWQHVLEPLYGYMLLAEKLWEQGDTFEGGWNFGADDKDARPVSWIADKLTALCGGHLRWEVSESAYQPHEAVYLKLDCSKAKALLGWKPVLELDKVLTWIVNWYKAYQQGANMMQACLDDITEYERLVK